LTAGKVPEYLERRRAELLENNFSYNSGSNPDFLSVEQIRHLIRAHVNPEFEPV